MKSFVGFDLGLPLED